MSSEVQVLLRGTRDNITSALEYISSNFKRYATTYGDKAPNEQMKYSLFVVRDLCQAIALPDSEHYDLYCDILLKVVAPHVKPKVNLMQWTKFLEFVRYFHYLLVDKSCQNQAVRVFDYLVGQPRKLYSEKDYKYVLGTYCQHLLIQRTVKQVDIIAYKKESNKALDALFELLVDMVYRQKTLKFIYPDFTDDFIQSLIPKCNLNHLNFIASLPDDKNLKIFQLFFDLISSAGNTGHGSKMVNSTHYFRQHMKALATFLFVDSKQQLRPRLAVMHLKVCGDLQILRHDKFIKYIVCLLDKYFALAYIEKTDTNFPATYKDVCQMFIKYLHKSTNTLAGEHWFHDILVLLNMLHSLMRQNCTSKSNSKDETCFEKFWMHMNEVELFRSHLEFIAACIKSIPDEIESKFTFWLCCKDLKNHMILSFVESAICCLSVLITNQCRMHNGGQLTNLSEIMDILMNDGLKAIKELKCLNADAYDLKMFYARCAQLTRDCTTPQQARFVFELAKRLIEIKHRFKAADWTLMLRRMYKAAEVMDNFPLIIELQTCYIASILKETGWPDLTHLRNQIALFHLGVGQTLVEDENSNLRCKCLTELHKTTTSIFKPSLTEDNLHLFHWMEMNYFFKYQRKNYVLQASLLRCCITDYDYVLLARVGKLTGETERKIRKILNNLRNKHDKAGGLDRMEALVMAHCCAIYLLQKLDETKEKLTFDIKMCQDDNMEELLNRKEFSEMSIANEMAFVNAALEALYYFEEFFNKVDKEVIPSNKYQIDWEVLLEDLESVVAYLHLADYIPHATQGWILIYRIGDMLLDIFYITRALGFLCEHIFNMEERRQQYWHAQFVKHFGSILDYVDNIDLMSRRQQIHILLAACYLGNYFDSCKDYGRSNELYNLLRNVHGKLPDRGGKYDAVLGTLNTLYLRNVWKQVVEEEARHNTLLVREVELTLTRLRDIFVSSGDTKPYMLLLFTFVHDMSECLAVRLYDNIIMSFMPAILKMALQTCSSHRVVEILAMWTILNLQTEMVDRAIVKVKLIECILGTSILKDLAVPKKIKDESESSLDAMRLAPNASKKNSINVVQRISPKIDVARKAIPKMYELQFKLKKELNPYLRNQNLQRFLSLANLKGLQPCELLQWGSFATGCLNARIFYLIEDYNQLYDFYTTSENWFQQKNIKMFEMKFHHFKLITTQHYINYLRAIQQYDSAMGCVHKALSAVAPNTKKIIDISFRVNLLFLKNMITLEQARMDKSTGMGGESLRRGLKFDEISPTNNAMVKALLEKAHDEMVDHVNKSVNDTFGNPLNGGTIYDKSLEELRKNVLASCDLNCAASLNGGGNPLKSAVKLQTPNTLTKSLAASKLKSKLIAIKKADLTPQRRVVKEMTDIDPFQIDLTSSSSDEEERALKNRMKIDAAQRTKHRALIEASKRKVAKSSLVVSDILKEMKTLQCSAQNSPPSDYCCNLQKKREQAQLATKIKQVEPTVAPINARAATRANVENVKPEEKKSTKSKPATRASARRRK